MVESVDVTGPHLPDAGQRRTMATATKRRLHKCVQDIKDKAESIGATMDVDNGERTIIIDAPSGYRWRANDATCIFVVACNGSQTWWADACRLAESDAAMGLERVDDQTELDAIRYELGDDDWGAADGAPQYIEWPA